jgi:zinc D-Ala-D-Ala carboxypeptidase
LAGVRGQAEDRKDSVQSRRRFILTIALGAALLAGFASSTPARGDASLPPCQHLDLPTVFDAPTDWQRTLVDTIFMVPRTYVPPDLVPVSEAGVQGNGSVRSLVIPELTALAAAAKAAGTPIAVQSAYRSYAYQVSTFQESVNQLGRESALAVSARPGHSEHQLGLAIDFRSTSGGAPWDGNDWAKTPAGAWMKANAWEFGFVMSYPSAAAKPTTCYGYEPWHYRYVGREVAAAIHAADVTTREYLWNQLGNSSMAGLVDSAPTPSTVSSAQATPVPTPAATPSPTAVPTATTGPATQPAGAGTTGSPGPAEPLSPVGASLAVAFGLVILVAVEQLDRTMRHRSRKPLTPPLRRHGSWSQARRSSSVRPL